MPILDINTNNLGTSLVRTFIYGRVSDDGQLKNRNMANGQDLTDDSASVKSQPRVCKDFINNYRGFCPKCRKNISLLYEDERFDGGETGTNFERSGADKMMGMAQNGEIDLVLAAENDRIGRNQYETQGIRNELIKLGVQVCTVNQPKSIFCSTCYNPFEDDSGVIMDMVSDVKSHLDLARIMRNYKVGMANRVRKGLPSGSLAYGLEKVRDEIVNGFRIQEYRFDKEKVKVVKRIVKEYLDLGLGMWKISQRLNVEGIPSSEGKKWGRSAIKCILNNPSYAGYTRYQRSIVASRKGQKIRIMQPKEKWTLEKAVWYKDRLWDMSYYEEILQTIENRYKIGGRASGSGGLLIGLLKCGYCGYSMFQENTKRKRDNGTIYTWRGYNCGTYAHRGSCIHNGKSQRVINDLVIKEIFKIVDNDKTKEAYLKKIHNQNASLSKEELSDKEQTLKGLNGRLSRASDAYLSKDFSLKEYSEEKKNILPRISELETEIDRLRNLNMSPQNDLIPDFIDIVKRIHEGYGVGECKNIQLLLRKIIQRIDFKRKPFGIKITFMAN
jgi:DNA invertase Pin-like site-specific DNA recombinase